MKKNLEIKRLVLASSLLAIAIVLDVLVSIIPGLNLSMPLGGSFFGLSLLPMVLIGLILGPVYGLVSGFIFGIFGFFYGGYTLSFFAEEPLDAAAIFMLDYGLAFMAYGISGFFKKGLVKRNVFVLSVVVVSLVRWIFSTASGAIFWAQYASSHQWTNRLYQTFNSAIIYSAIYNITYVATTALITIIIGLLIHKRIQMIARDFTTIPASDPQ